MGNQPLELTNTTPPPFHFTILEDDEKLRQGYVRDLELLDLEGKVTSVDDDESLSEALLVESDKKVFWVDIHQGDGREDQGIGWIKLIRTRYPEALIIAYTAYKFHEKACMKAGANLFFVKGGGYQKHIKEIRAEILKFIQHENKFFFVSEFYGKIVNIGEEAIKIHYFLESDVVETYVAKGIIAATLIGEPKVNDAIKVSVVVKGATVKHVFNRIQKLPPEIFNRQNRAEKYGDDELMDSSFWTNFY